MQSVNSPLGLRPQNVKEFTSPRLNLSPEEQRMARLRSNWDPFDSLEKIERDGTKSRNGRRVCRSEDRKRIAHQVKSGELHLPRATELSTDVVYIVQADDGGPAKIGHSTYGSMERRLKMLQVGNHKQLVVRALFDGGTWLEYALHEFFVADRLLGEWFDVSPRMREMCPELI